MAGTAIVRSVPRSYDRCLREVDCSIDVEVARRQHEAYVEAIRGAGWRVVSLAPLDDAPDSVFVEDPVVVLDRHAVVANVGAPSRRGEAKSIAPSLSQRVVVTMQPPATLDGGDVLRLDRRLLVGVGTRTNQAGVAQLAAIVEPLGYTVTPVTMGQCLHLKSAVTEAAPDVVVINPEWVDAALFKGLHIIEVDPAEPHAANVLRLGATVLCASKHERTNSRLFAAGLDVRTVDVSELAKAEGAVTCCSVIFKGEPVNR